MAETSGLLNRRTGNSRTEGSNPSVSAKPSSVIVREIPTDWAKAALCVLCSPAQVLKLALSPCGVIMPLRTHSPTSASMRLRHESLQAERAVS